MPQVSPTNRSTSDQKSASSPPPRGFGSALQLAQNKAASSPVAAPGRSAAPPPPQSDGTQDVDAAINEVKQELGEEEKSLNHRGWLQSSANWMARGATAEEIQAVVKWLSRVSRWPTVFSSLCTATAARAFEELIEWGRPLILESDLRGRHHHERP